MRDPAGRLSFEHSTVVRHLSSPIGTGDFLSSQLAQDLVSSGRLLHFEKVDLYTVASPRLPFVSYPFEWCDAQLRDAALLTLQIEQQAVASGFSLKDASAWNVLYQGTCPVFCDHLSFELLSARHWWALGQFTRHFVAPLEVSRRRALNAHRAFRAWRDGMPVDTARALLGPMRFASRYWPLFIGGDGSPAVQARPLHARVSAPDNMKAVQSFRAALLVALKWMINGLDSAQADASERPGWTTYIDRRGHYGDGGVAEKRDRVGNWLERIQPAWVVDLGCNTGEFSELALTRGSSVVAIDADHDAVQCLYCRLPNHPRLYPVVADIDDFSGGRGWAGEEFIGLADRLAQRFDVLMMLALIHHLMISAAIPVEAIADLCARCTRGWLIVELIDESDGQLKLLCAQRCRDPRDFSMQRQRDAFLMAGFELDDEVALSPTPRCLLLMRRR